MCCTERSLSTLSVERATHRNAVFPSGPKYLRRPWDHFPQCPLIAQSKSDRGLRNRTGSELSTSWLRWPQQQCVCVLAEGIFFMQRIRIPVGLSPPTGLNFTDSAPVFTDLFCSSVFITSAANDRRRRHCVLRLFVRPSVVRPSTSTPCPKKIKQICFCQNFVKFPQISIIFGRKMGNDPNMGEVHSFSTSPNLRHHLTVLNANVPNCYITPNVVICNKLLTT